MDFGSPVNLASYRSPVARFSGRCFSRGDEGGAFDLEPKKSPFRREADADVSYIADFDLDAPLLDIDADDLSEEDVFPSPCSFSPSKLESTEVRGSFVVALCIGFVNALIALPVMVSFSRLIFQNPFFDQYRSTLTKLVILSAAIHQSCFTLKSTLPFSIGQVQDVGLIFLGSIANALVHWRTSRGVAITDDVLLAFVLTALQAATFFTGVLLTTIGRQRISQYVQLLPLQVVGGYLAYIGFYLILGGASLLSGLQITSVMGFADLIQNESALVKFLPGAVCGIALYVLAINSKSPLALPFALLAIPALFFAVLFLGGWSLDDARRGEWLAPMPGGAIDWRFWKLFEVYDPLAAYDVIVAAGGWHVLLVHWLPTTMVLALVVAFGSSLDVAAIAADVTKPMDYDHEVTTVGISNIVVGSCGGFTGSYIFSQTLFTMKNERSGSRIPGMVVAGVELAVYMLPAQFSLLEYTPDLLFGSVMLFIGMDLCSDWLWHCRHRMGGLEFAQTWMSFLLICFFGLQLGFLLGILVSGLGYAFSVAQLPVAEEARAASSMQRDTLARKQLYDLRFRLRRLQFKSGSYIFFGSAMSAANAAIACATKAELEEEKSNAVNEAVSPANTAPRIFVLDLTGVTGVDATAARTLSALRTQLSSLSGHWFLVAAGAVPSVASLLEEHGLQQGRIQGLRDTAEPAWIGASTDAMLERCENLLLSWVHFATRKPTLRSILSENLSEGCNNSQADSVGLGVNLDELELLFERRTLAGGETFYPKGDDSTFFGIVERGGAQAGSPVYLRFGSGCAIGVLDYILSRRRQYSMVAESGGLIVQVLTRRAVESASPAAQALITKYLLKTIALRVAHSHGLE